MNFETVVGLQPGPNPAAPPGLVSVLIPCCGQLEYTKLCLASLLRHSRPPVEFVFLDIGSMDGTEPFLAGVALAAPVRVEAVRTLTDQGIPAAIQEALARAQGEYLLLLNNDTIVTHGWLDQLTALAGTAPEIGLVGPMSNKAAPPQKVDGVPYRLGPKAEPPVDANGLCRPVRVDVTAVERFAAELRDKYRGQCEEVDSLGGFCLLVKRVVLERLGSLATGSGLGVFDSAVLCRQAQAAGYRLALCKDLFIHNFGSRVLGLGRPQP